MKKTILSMYTVNMTNIKTLPQSYKDYFSGTVICPHTGEILKKSLRDYIWVRIREFLFFNNATFTVWTGRPGAGKSSKFVDTHIRIMQRNKLWYQRLTKYPIEGFLPVPRIAYTNSAIDPLIIQKLGLQSFYGKFHGIHEALQLRNADIFWDEIQTDCHIDQNEKLPRGFESGSGLDESSTKTYEPYCLRSFRCGKSIT